MLGHSAMTSHIFLSSSWSSCCINGARVPTKMLMCHAVCSCQSASCPRAKPSASMTERAHMAARRITIKLRKMFRDAGPGFVDPDAGACKEHAAVAAHCGAGVMPCLGRRSAVPGLITAAWNAAGVATALPLCGERAPAMSAAVRTSTQLVVTNLCSACTATQ